MSGVCSIIGGGVGFSDSDIRSEEGRVPPAAVALLLRLILLLRLLRVFELEKFRENVVGKYIEVCSQKHPIAQVQLLSVSYQGTDKLIAGLINFSR